jgi:hypothetical protein
MRLNKDLSAMIDTIKSAFITMLSFFLWVSIGTEQEVTLKLDASDPIAEIQPTMYGIFFEDINFAADGGLYAEVGSDAPEAVNSFGIPENITPEEYQFTLKPRDEPGLEISSLSFAPVKLNIR